MSRARATLQLLLVLCLAGESRAADEESAAAESGIEPLMERFAANRGVRARFREARHLALLTDPIESAGVLYFAPPDHLARHTTWPGSARIVVRGTQLAFQDETGHQTLDLGASEVARHFVSDLAVLLRGDLPGLRARYVVAFRAEGRGWVLDLEPRAPVVRRLVAWMRVEGRGSVLTRLETRETNGDTTVLSFEQVETGLDFSAAERERIFSLDERSSGEREK